MPGIAFALPEIEAPRCTACGHCIETCHVQALTLDGTVVVLCHPERCDYCTECELVCPSGAITCPFDVVVEEM